MKRKAEDCPGSPLSKKLNAASDQKACFRDDLFVAETRDSFRSAYRKSQPYSHAVVPTLIQDELLRKVRKEIIEHVHFTLKETDIYRIHQSGDLANLSSLAAEELKHLPSLVTLRDALYSEQFRTWISDVTGAGKVSGTKTDMAINVYTPGSYLLCHDDVIGSRRISYILYLTDPDEPWRPEWGGGLRLYPTEIKKNKKGGEVKVPLAEHTVNIPPSFGQLSFFAVRPGESYHDVEEVYHGKEGKRIRMAISGWYHIPQEGEDGHEEGIEESQAQKSSLAQLKGAADEFDQPAERFFDLTPISNFDEDILTEPELIFLLKYITPQYLTPEMTDMLAASFIDDSVVQLEGFLNHALADKMQGYINEVAETEHWHTARPPHKHRFQYLMPWGLSLIQTLLHELLQSVAFRKWLGFITGVSPTALTRQNVFARRFRKGKDYALASIYQEEKPRLEYTIGLTPDTKNVMLRVPSAEMNGVNSTNGSHTDTNGMHVDVSGEHEYGGEEIYMAGDEEGEEDISTDGPPPVGTKAVHDPAVYKTGVDEDDDAILFIDKPSWNTLSIVMRDQGTLRFVNYVSQAGRDRWDIKGEIKIDHEDESDGLDEHDSEAEVSDIPVVRVEEQQDEI